MKKKRTDLNKTTVFDVVLVILMLAFIACIIFPFMHVISVSVSHPGPAAAGQVGIWPIGFNLDTYKQIAENAKMLNAYGTTLFITVVGTALSLTTTAMGAYALSRKHMFGRRVFSLMITITMFFGGGLVPTFLAVSNYGLIDTVWAMIIPSLISTWNLIVMRSFFIAFPSEIIESGMIDGLQDVGVFFRLVLPTSKAALATIGLYYAVSYWNSYMPARLYIRDAEIYPVQHLLQQLIAKIDVDYVQEEQYVVSNAVRYATIMVVIIPIMCVYPFIQKYFVKGVMVGSIKG